MYPAVLDMCSNTSRISDGFYLTSSGFPAGFNQTGLCVCTAKSVEQNTFVANVDIVHVALPDEELCNEELLISEDYGWSENLNTRCSPSLMMPRRYLVNIEGITVSFRRKSATKSNKKTVVWIGIGSKYWHRGFPNKVNAMLKIARY